jgi:multidrug transporter EmrE-like cation transporter
MAHHVTTGYSFLLVGVLLNAAGQLLLKAGTNAVGRFEFVASNLVPVATRFAFEPYIFAGVFCYAVSLVVWILGLSRVEVSVAYPLLSLGSVINAAAAWYLFGESLSLMRQVMLASPIRSSWKRLKQALGNLPAGR